MRGSGGTWLGDPEASRRRSVALGARSQLEEAWPVAGVEGVKRPLVARVAQDGGPCQGQSHLASGLTTGWVHAGAQPQMSRGAESEGPRQHLGCVCPAPEASDAAAGSRPPGSQEVHNRRHWTVRFARPQGWRPSSRSSVGLRVKPPGSPPLRGVSAPWSVDLPTDPTWNFIL